MHKKCIFSIYICPVKSVLSVYDEAHRGSSRESKKEKLKTLKSLRFSDLAITSKYSEKSKKAPFQGPVSV